MIAAISGYETEALFSKAHLRLLGCWVSWSKVCHVIRPDRRWAPSALVESMGAAGSVVTDCAPSDVAPPDPATLRAALEALTSAPPPTSAADARIAAAAVKRLAGRQRGGSSAAPGSPGVGGKLRKSAFLHGTPAVPASLADSVNVKDPPALSNVGVGDLSRLLAPPPATLRIEARAGVLDMSAGDWSDSLGVYKLVDGLAIRGRPVWRLATGADRWLAFTPHGWMVRRPQGLTQLCPAAHGIHQCPLPTDHLAPRVCPSGHRPYPLHRLLLLRRRVARMLHPAERLL